MVKPLYEILQVLTTVVIAGGLVYVCARHDSYALRLSPVTAERSDVRTKLTNV
jgi:hypothetical protein